uniref:Putative secreted protein n=1 Tax=Anopheles triannulatus TaxID=58253 RepID=A0A2M4B4Y3_9DIPT
MPIFWNLIWSFSLSFSHAHSLSLYRRGSNVPTIVMYITTFFFSVAQDPFVYKNLTPVVRVRKLGLSLHLPKTRTPWRHDLTSTIIDP